LRTGGINPLRADIHSAGNFRAAQAKQETGAEPHIAGSKMRVCFREITEKGRVHSLNPFLRFQPVVERCHVTLGKKFGLAKLDKRNRLQSGHEYTGSNAAITAGSSESSGASAQFTERICK
ncbi:MAG: hypothetical protein ACREBW_09730, partial [Candidatus Micrarchaeaceae archaeon]